MPSKLVFMPPSESIGKPHIPPFVARFECSVFVVPLERDPLFAGGCNHKQETWAKCRHYFQKKPARMSRSFPTPGRHRRKVGQGFQPVCRSLEMWTRTNRCKIVLANQQTATAPHNSGKLPPQECQLYGLRPKCRHYFQKNQREYPTLFQPLENATHKNDEIIGPTPAPKHTGINKGAPVSRW